MRWYSLLCLGLLATANFTGCGKGDAPKQIDIPKTPDGTVGAVATAVSDGKFEVIWQAMPESYQKKINTVIQEFAEHTDPEVYNKVMGVVGKLVKVLNDKQEFILGTDMVKSEIASGKTTKEEVKEGLSAMAGLLGDLQGDIKTKDDLEKLDVEKYLANIGSRIKAIEPVLTKYGNTPVKFGDEMAKLKKIKVTAKDVTTDSATVEITDADGKTKSEKMVRVEGKWVPKAMHDEFPKALDEMAENIHKSEEKIKQMKPQIMGGAAMAEGVLDNLLKATTQEEFNKAITDAVAGFGGAMTLSQ